jgi:hypothetical protein
VLLRRWVPFLAWTSLAVSMTVVEGLGGDGYRRFLFEV